MTDSNQQFAPENILNAEAVAPKHAHEDAFKKAEKIRPKRTVGERVVDTLVYPIINNVGVFAISVGATYLTKHGDSVGKETSYLRKFGNFMKGRGDWVESKLITKFGMNKDSADMTKMVFFSFADGTLVAPFVKVLEDRREQMAKGIDRTLHTQPVDDSAYKVEPKQTWGSVIKGRLATSLVVVPTAVVLDLTKKDANGWHFGKNAPGDSLNTRMFEKPSEKISALLEKKTNLKVRFPKIDMHDLSKTIAFEAFYTSVCTGGLYLISRAIAKHNRQNKAAVEEYRATHSPAYKPAADTAEAAPQAASNSDNVPQPYVSQTTHIARVAASPTQEITV